MTLPLPNLDDRTYSDLIEYARKLIPREYPEWTDHNPSDPGIVQLELLAWLTEMVIYRVNQIPDRNYYQFLKLLNGHQWQLPQDKDLQTAIGETVLDLRKRYRAITSKDFEQLVLQDWHGTKIAQDLGNIVKIERVKCFPQRNLVALTSAERNKFAAGHISLVVVPENLPHSTPVIELDGVKDYLQIPGDSIPSGEQITISFWTQGGEAMPKASSIMGALRSDGKRVLNIHLPWSKNGRETVYFDCGDGGSSEFDRIFKDINTVDYKGRWVHWTFTKNSATGEMKIYLDGELWHHEGGKTRYLSPASRFTIGCYDSRLFFYPGMISELQIWQRALSVEEIRRNMYRHLSGKEEGLVSYWQFQEGNGEITTDATPSQRQGRIMGAPKWLPVNFAQLPIIPNLNELLHRLWMFLDERRLLTVRHHIIPPEFVVVKITAQLWLTEGADAQNVTQIAVQQLRKFFDPLQGGHQGTGWNFGRPVYISEVYKILDNVPGVDYVKKVRLQDDAELKHVAIQDYQLVAIDISQENLEIKEAWEIDGNS